MELLKSLDKNTKILNISNCGLKGVLDLSEFDIEHQVTEVIGNQNRYCTLSFIGYPNEK